MPNRPEDPYGRFPPGAAIGLFLMFAGAVTLLFLSATWADWRQAILGGLILFALIGIALLVRRLKWPALSFGRKAATPVSAPQDPPPRVTFDPADFIDAARRQQDHTLPRRIEAKPGRDSAAERQQAREEGTIRRLQDLRDHPATPEPERQAAEAKLKKARSKRRSAWKARP
ncbi:hypothetical protein [Methylorubrum sp. SB2]|uniref:hypothetical protein n=1 Tax=Methylorubrum subtropicum TaxID=3138812 RepID=UPI00313CE15A